MIDAQLETFPGHERFVFALLGMLSTLDHVRAVLELRDEAPTKADESSELLDFALGVVSLSRTAHAIASCATVAGETEPDQGVQSGSGAVEPAPRWLR
jgi:hypothetical protein